MPELQEKGYDSDTSAVDSSGDEGQADCRPTLVSPPSKTKKRV